jgi:hypothetical protein
VSRINPDIIIQNFHIKKLFTINLKTIAYNRVTASLLIFSGIAVFVASVTILGIGWMSNAIGCAVFFVVACFLPETCPVTFLSRKSSLGLVCFFSWMMGTEFLRYSESDFLAAVHPNIYSTIVLAGPAFLGIFTYWISVFLIRGFRAKPEQGMHELTSKPRHVTSASSSVR